MKYEYSTLFSKQIKDINLMSNDVEKFRELEKRSDLKEFKFLAELYIINVEDEELFVDVVIEQDGEILDDYTGDSYGYVDRVAKDSVVCYLQDREDIEPHKYPAGE